MSNSHQPYISVVMPVYNADQFLVSSVRSILHQTFTNFEFIIINDGSTDTSEQKLNHLRENDPRIRLISRENKGLTATLNEGVRYAQGMYIARMDADDIALPERFAKQVLFLDTHPDHVAVGSRVLLIDPDNSPICLFSTETEHDAIDQAHLAGKGGAICHPALMVRRSALERVGGYREIMSHAEDLDLFLRLAELGKLANLPETLMHYRMHPRSIGHEKRSEQYESAVRAVSEAYRRRGLDMSNHHRHKSEAKRQLTISELYEKWAWWSLHAGNTKTARKHAWLALRHSPVSMKTWKAFACAIRGY